MKRISALTFILAATCAGEALVLWDQFPASQGGQSFVNQEYTDYLTFQTFMADDFKAGPLAGLRCRRGLSSRQALDGKLHRGGVSRSHAIDSVSR